MTDKRQQGAKERKETWMVGRQLKTDNPEMFFALLQKAKEEQKISLENKLKEYE